MRPGSRSPTHRCPSPALSRSIAERRRRVRRRPHRPAPRPARPPGAVLAREPHHRRWSPTGSSAAGLADHPTRGAPALVAEIGTEGPLVALRADLDALPVPTSPATRGRAPSRASPTPAATTCTPPRWSAPRSRWPRSTTRGLLPGRVRLLFQPAEEVMPGGALHADRAGRPRRRRRGSSACTATPASTSARSGCGRARSPAPPTALDVTLTGTGGHTSRPHLTEDLTFALGKVITELPAILSPPARPARRRQRGVGDASAPARPTT